MKISATLYMGIHSLKCAWYGSKVSCNCVLCFEPKISLYINLCHVMAIDCAKNAENVNCIFLNQTAKLQQ